MLIKNVRRLGQNFLANGYILEYKIFRFPKIILIDRYDTSYVPVLFCLDKYIILNIWNGKKIMYFGTRLLALHLIVYFCRKLHRIFYFNYNLF